MILGLPRGTEVTLVMTALEAVEVTVAVNAPDGGRAATALKPWQSWCFQCAMCQRQRGRWLAGCMAS